MRPEIIQIKKTFCLKIVTNQSVLHKENRYQSERFTQENVKKIWDPNNSHQKDVLFENRYQSECFTQENRYQSEHFTEENVKK